MPGAFDPSYRQAPQRHPHQARHPPRLGRRPAPGHPRLQGQERPRPLRAHQLLEHRDLPRARRGASDLEAFERGLDADDKSIGPSMVYAYAALMEGVPYANGTPSLTADVPGARARSRTDKRRAPRRQGLQDRPDHAQDRARAHVQGAHARCAGLVQHQHPRQPRRRGARRARELQGQGSHQARRARHHLAARACTPSSTATSTTRCASTITRPRRLQRGLGQHRHLRVAGLPDADQGRLPLPRLHPGRTHRARPRALPRPGGPHRPQGRAGVAVASTGRAR
jgi:hypothetical protein